MKDLQGNQWQIIKPKRGSEREAVRQRACLQRGGAPTISLEEGATPCRDTQADPTVSVPWREHEVFLRETTAMLRIGVQIAPHVFVCVGMKLNFPKRRIHTPTRLKPKHAPVNADSPHITEDKDTGSSLSVVINTPLQV